MRQKLNHLDAMIQESGGVQERDTLVKDAYVEVETGTSALIQVPGFVQRIDEVSSGSKHLGPQEVMRRLAMGDDGIQANRVLHLAFLRGQPHSPGSLVGCMSSTYQPPWTEQGCGHWGLLAVDPAHQGKGVAKTLVRVGEARLAAVCHEIQMEYRYSSGEADSERLKEWYEDRLGFVCPNGPPSTQPGDREFRQCRKRINSEEQEAGQRRRMVEVRAFLVEQLEAADTTAMHDAEEHDAMVPEDDDEEEASMYEDDEEHDDEALVASVNA